MRGRVPVPPFQCRPDLIPVPFNSIPSRCVRSRIRPFAPVKQRVPSRSHGNFHHKDRKAPSNTYSVDRISWCSACRVPSRWSESIPSQRVRFRIRLFASVKQRVPSRLPSWRQAKRHHLLRARLLKATCPVPCCECTGHVRARRTPPPRTGFRQPTALSPGQGIPRFYAHGNNPENFGWQRVSRCLRTGGWGRRLRRPQCRDLTKAHERDGLLPRVMPISNRARWSVGELGECSL